MLKNATLWTKFETLHQVKEVRPARPDVVSITGTTRTGQSPDRSGAVAVRGLVGNADWGVTPQCVWGFPEGREVVWSSAEVAVAQYCG